MTEASKSSVTIKKYANRRLYNTATSSYVTLEDLAQMVKGGTEFNVYDAKTGEELTRSVLTQIIVEEESKSGQNLLPISFLRQLIGFYGDNLQWLVPKYLDHSMQALAKNQSQIRDYFQSAFGGMFPFGTTLQEMGKQNMAMFEQAMRLFAPFGVTVPGQPASSSKTNDIADAADSPPEQSSMPSNAPASAPSHVKPMAPHEAMAQHQPAPQSTPMSSGGDDVQNKITALQRQLADLARGKA